MPELSQRIRHEQLAVMTKQSAMAVLANVSIGGVMSAAVSPFVDDRGLLIWYAAIVAAALARMVAALVVKRRLAEVTRPMRWLRLFAALAGVSGVGWGVASVLYMHPEQPMVFTLCILALGGMASGAVGSLSAYLPAYFAFSSATLFPITIRFAYEGGTAGWSISLMSLTYILAVFSFARVANRTMIDAVRLRFANEDLVRQLTEEKERALAAQERAEQAVLSKSKFLAAASHDLRQPAHALSLFVGTLEARARGDAELAFIADRIQASTLALKTLLDGLLDISRLDAGTVEARPRPTPLWPMMQKIADEFALAADDQGIELRAVETSLWAHTDGDMLERILRNLVSNAVRYTPRGKVLIGCRRGSPLRLCVWDTGVGIPEDKTDEIFLELRQLHNPERDRSKGLGLGLAIVRRLGLLLGHRVTVQSRLGAGSCFTVELPPAAPLPIVPSPAIDEPALDLLRGRRVLVIDDESLARDALRSILESWGCSVWTAGSGREAADVASASGEPEVVLVDYRLRDHETGLQAIRAVCQRLGRDLPAIIITGDTAPERIREAEATGYPLLHKPLTPAMLHVALETVLDDSAAAADPA